MALQSISIVPPILNLILKIVLILLVCSIYFSFEQPALLRNTGILTYNLLVVSCESW
jgi:hypothetical protein